MTSSINNQIDPCVDFYEHVCNGFMSKKNINQSFIKSLLSENKQETINHQTNIQEKNDKIILDIFQRRHDKYIQTDLFSNVFNYFDKCLAQQGNSNQLKNNDDVVHQMLTKIKELRNLMAGNYTLNTEWIEAIFPTVPFVQDEHHFHEFPLSIPFFQFGANVNEEPEEVKKTNAFEVIFELYSKNMSSKNYYEKIIRDLIKHSVVARNFFFSKQEKRLESEIASWLEDMENVTNELDKIIDDYDNASGEKFLDTMTLGELKELTPLIDWTKILSHFNSQINSNTHIEIKCVECIEKWQKFSLENKFQIKQYLEMIIVEKYYLPVMKLREDFEKSGINKKQYCINKTKEHFDWVIDRLFIEHIKFPGTIRKDIKLFFEKYKKLFVEIISKNVWMSEKDKEKALERARQIEFEPAYFYGDIKLDKHFNELNSCLNFTSKMSFAEMELRTISCRIQKQIKKDYIVDEERLYYLKHFYSPSYNTEVIYDSVKNKAFVPASLLQKPFYELEMPEMMKFSGIGVLMGTSILEKLFFKIHSKEHLDKASECFSTEISKKSCNIEDYYGITCKITDNYQLPINLKSKQHKYESYNDFNKLFLAFGGLEVSLEAMKFQTNEDKKEFFMNFAFSSCDALFVDDKKVYLPPDIYSKGKSLINLTLRNIPEFSNTFDCLGKSMYKKEEDQCKLW